MLFAQPFQPVLQGKIGGEGGETVESGDEITGHGVRIRPSTLQVIGAAADQALLAALGGRAGA